MKTCRHSFTYTTLTMVLVIMLSIFYACKSTPEHPKTGDIYFHQLNDGQFAIIEITNTTRKRVSFLKNDYSVSALLFIDSVTKAPNYSDEPETLSYIEFKSSNYHLYKSKPNKK